MMLHGRGRLFLCLALAGLSAPASAEQPSSTVEDRLSKEVTLELALETALEQSPLMHEAHARARAAEARVGASGRRPDPELTYQQWSVPLSEPWALQESSMIMLGLSQTFPAPGSLPAQKRAAESDARIGETTLATRSLDLALQVKRAFAAYSRAQEELTIRREHLELTKGLIDLARVQYQASQISQESVLRAGIEVARVESELVMAEQELASAAALLNTLMGRATKAPLGPARTTTPSTPPADELDTQLDERRPEIAAAELATEKSEALVDDAHAQSNRPMFMVGVDLMYDAMREGPAYTAMFSMTLPWLNPGRGAAVNAAREELAAQAHALEAVRLNARYELADATSRVESARRTLSLLDDHVLPQARRSFDAARAAFVSGAAPDLIESLRALLQSRIDRARAAQRLALAVADLERAAGLPSHASSTPSER